MRVKRNTGKPMSDFTFAILTTSIVAVFVLFAIFVIGNDGGISSECDEHGNLVYQNGDNLYVVEGADPCSSNG